eukprot:m.40696 g.40696  ORF g.40696 m.40696 type:complete len:347 (+) comp5627_c0_seq1:128-1168(+)
MAICHRDPAWDFAERAVLCVWAARAAAHHHHPSICHLLQRALEGQGCLVHAISGHRRRHHPRIRRTDRGRHHLHPSTPAGHAHAAPGGRLQHRHADARRRRVCAAKLDRPRPQCVPQQGNHPRCGVRRAGHPARAARDPGPWRHGRPDRLPHLHCGACGEHRLGHLAWQAARPGREDALASRAPEARCLSGPHLSAGRVPDRLHRRRHRQDPVYGPYHPAQDTPPQVCDHVHHRRRPVLCPCLHRALCARRGADPLLGRRDPWPADRIHARPRRQRGLRVPPGAAGLCAHPRHRGRSLYSAACPGLVVVFHDLSLPYRCLACVSRASCLARVSRWRHDARWNRVAD